MRFLSVLILLSAFSAVAFGQTAAIEPKHVVHLNADKVAPNGSVLEGHGHARANMDGLVFHSDDAIWHINTGELELRGHVEVTLVARPNHGTFHFQTGDPATDKAGVVFADKVLRLSANHMTDKDGRLEASGTVAVRAPGTELHSDGMSMVLSTGEASMSGHVVATGSTASEPGHAGTPEVVK